MIRFRTGRGGADAVRDGRRGHGLSCDGSDSSGECSVTPSPKFTWIRSTSVECRTRVRPASGPRLGPQTPPRQLEGDRPRPVAAPSAPTATVAAGTKTRARRRVGGREGSIVRRHHAPARAINRSPAARALRVPIGGGVVDGERVPRRASVNGPTPAAQRSNVGQLAGTSILSASLSLHPPIKPTRRSFQTRPHASRPPHLIAPSPMASRCRR